MPYEQTCKHDKESYRKDIERMIAARTERNLMVLDDMAKPFEEMDYFEDEECAYLIDKLSFGMTSYREHLYDLLDIWAAYSAAYLPKWKMFADGVAYEVQYDNAPPYALAYQIKRHEQDTREGSGVTHMTSGVKLVQDAIDAGIKEVIDAYINHGIPAADLCAGRG